MASRPLTVGARAFDVTTAFSEIFKVVSPAIRAGIDAVVFNNYSTANVKFTVRIVSSGVTPTVLNEIITDKEIRRGSNDLAVAMIGQALNLGDSVEVKASVNTSVSGHITVTNIDS